MVPGDFEVRDPATAERSEILIELHGAEGRVPKEELFCVTRFSCDILRKPLEGVSLVVGGGEGVDDGRPPGEIPFNLYVVGYGGFIDVRSLIDVCHRNRVGAFSGLFAVRSLKCEVVFVVLVSVGRRFVVQRIE